MIFKNKLNKEIQNIHYTKFRVSVVTELQLAFEIYC